MNSKHYSSKDSLRDIIWSRLKYKERDNLVGVTYIDIKDHLIGTGIVSFRTEDTTTNKYLANITKFSNSVANDMITNPNLEISIIDYISATILISYPICVQ
jgi:hypothetical protein